MASTNVGSIHYDLSLDKSKFEKSADSVLDRVSSVGKSFLKFGALAGGAVAGFSALSVKAFTEAENAMTQTEAVLKSTGGVAGVTAEQVSELASSLQSVTAFADETIQSGQNILLTFTNIGKNIFPQATEVMLDMSQALGQDVKSSAIQLGKALQDPILGVTALRRVGVNFTESQQDMIKSLVESGRTLEAQKMILKELQIEFGGSAKAAGTTFAGKLAILKNRLGDIQEVVGKLLTDAITPAVSAFADFVTKVDWEQVITRSKDSIVAFKNELVRIYQIVFNYVSPGLERFWNTLKILADALYMTVVPSLKALWDKFGEILPRLKELWDAIEPGFTGALKVLASVLGAILLTQLWVAINMFNLFVTTTTFVIDVVSQLIQWLGNLVGAYINVWKELWKLVNALWDFGRDFIKGLWNGMKDAWREVTGWIGSIPNMIKGMVDLRGILWDAGWHAINSLWEGAKSGWNKVSGWFKGLAKEIKDIKGPIEKDRIMLLDEGKAIMQGFQKGLLSGYSNVRSTLQGISKDINPTFAGSNMTNNNSTSIYGNVNIGSQNDAEDFFRRINREQINVGNGIASLGTSYV